MTWKKLLSFPQWQPKTGTRQIWRIIFMGGHLLRQAVRHPSLTKLVIIFMWFDKGHVVINSWIIIWISNVANSRNVDLTGKQHSRHQQFWRFPFSPLEAGGRLPRSRDHLFSYSMSKASPPQGPDMWYLTFYENKVPIYQTTISNSLYFKISPWPLLYETVEQNLMKVQMVQLSLISPMILWLIFFSPINFTW